MQRYDINCFQFPTVLASMLCSTIPVSIVGIRLAMGINRFWKPEQYSQLICLLLLMLLNVPAF